MSKMVEIKDENPGAEHFRLRHYNHELKMIEKRHESELISVKARHESEKNRLNSRFADGNELDDKLDKTN